MIRAAALAAALALAGCAEASEPHGPHRSGLQRHAPGSLIQKHVAPSSLEKHVPGCASIDMPHLRHLDVYDCEIRKAVRQYAHGLIAPENIKAEIEVESDGRMSAVSHAGARCAMQLLPTTFASMLPRGDIDDPADCIRAGVKYRKFCARFWTKGLRPEPDRWGPLSELCYNAGPGGGLNAQGRCGGYTSAEILPCAPREARNYVVRISGLVAGKPRHFWTGAD